MNIKRFTTPALAVVGAAVIAGGALFAVQSSNALQAARDAHTAQIQKTAQERSILDSEPQTRAGGDTQVATSGENVAAAQQVGSITF